MNGQGAYGQGLASRFQQDRAQAGIACVHGKAEIAVTELRSDNPRPFMSGSLPCEDAFLVALHLRHYPRYEYWENGQQAPVTDLRAGDIVLHDLKRDPMMRINKPFHALFFYLPRAALNAVADENHVPRIGELDYRPGVGIRDDAVNHLGSSLLTTLGQPQQASRMFIVHLLLAVATHVAQTYGGMNAKARPVRGGLASWQERRAKEILSSTLDGEVSLKDIASQCGLSISYFSRAFRQSTGMAPHRWLIERRIEAAKALLASRTASLSDIALRCGFADQSHFTRAFSNLVGSSPGAWRRMALQ